MAAVSADMAGHTAAEAAGLSAEKEFADKTDHTETGWSADKRTAVHMTAVSAGEPAARMDRTKSG